VGRRSAARRWLALAHPEALSCSGKIAGRRFTICSDRFVLELVDFHRTGNCARITAESPLSISPLCRAFIESGVSNCHQSPSAQAALFRVEAFGDPAAACLSAAAPGPASCRKGTLELGLALSAGVLGAALPCFPDLRQAGVGQPPRKSPSDIQSLGIPEFGGPVAQLFQPSCPDSFCGFSS